MPLSLGMHSVNQGAERRVHNLAVPALPPPGPSRPHLCALHTSAAQPSAPWGWAGFPMSSPQLPASSWLDGEVVFNSLLPIDF